MPQCNNIIKDFKVNALPLVGVPNARYYVLNVDGTIDEYITDLFGAFHKVGSAILISAGTTFSNLNSVTFSNSNNVSFGLSNGVITAIAATGGGGGNINFSAGTTSQNLGNVIFSNANGVSFGLDGSTITATVRTDYLTTAMLSNANTGFLSVSQSTLFQATSLMSNYQSTGNYLTTAALSQDSSKYAGTNAAITGGSITVNTSGISISLPAYLTTAMLSNQNTNFVQATAVFNGTNASGTIASNGISISVAAQSTQPVAASASNGSFNFSTLRFVETDGVTWATSTDGIRASVQTNYQSPGAYLTTAMLSNAGSNFVNTSAVLNLTNISATFNSNNISLSVAAAGAASFNISAGTTSSDLTHIKFIDSNGVSWSLDTGSKIYATVKTDYQTSGAYLTTAMQSNAATISNINVSAGTTSNNLSAITFSDSNGVSFGLNGSVITATVATNYQSAGAYLTTAMASNRGSDFMGTNTALTANGVSVTANSSGLSLNFPAFLTTQSNQAFSAQGGSSTFQTLVFTNSNGFSFSNTGGSIWGSYTVPTLTNSSLTVGAGTQTLSSVSRIEFINSNGVSFGASTSNNGSITITATVKTDYAGTGTTFGGTNVSASITLNTNGLVLSLSGASALADTTFSGINPYEDMVMMQLSHGNGTLILDPVTLPNVQFDRVMMPINNSNSSNSSGSHSLTFRLGIYTQNASSLSLLTSVSRSTALTHSGTQGSYSLFSNMRLFSLGLTTTLTWGKYWLGVWSSTSSAGANGSYSQYCLTQMNVSFQGHFGSSNNTTQQWSLGQGFYTVTTASMPGSIAFSQIRGSDSNAFRMPVIMLVSGTV